MAKNINPHSGQQRFKMVKRALGFMNAYFQKYHTLCTTINETMVGTPSPAPSSSPAPGISSLQGAHFPLNTGARTCRPNIPYPPPPLGIAYLYFLHAEGICSLGRFRNFRKGDRTCYTVLEGGGGEKKAAELLETLF